MTTDDGKAFGLTEYWSRPHTLRQGEISINKIFGDHKCIEKRRLRRGGSGARPGGDGLRDPVLEPADDRQDPQETGLRHQDADQVAVGVEPGVGAEEAGVGGKVAAAVGVLPSLDRTSSITGYRHRGHYLPARLDPYLAVQQSTG